MDQNLTKPTLLRGLRNFVFLILGLCLAPLASSQTNHKSGWKITKIEGKDYLSVQDIQNFYNFTKLSRNGNKVILENTKVEMELTVGGHECLMNNLKFVFSDPVIAQGNGVYVSRIDLAKLIDPVLRPNFIKSAGVFQTVIIDAGHGGKDPGATNPLGTEAQYNLKLAGKLKTQLEAKGFKVIMTRTTDKYYSLQERVDIANRVKQEAIFISLHFNAGGREARGIETFTLSPPGVSHYGSNLKASDAQARAGNYNDSANIALATAIHGSVLHRLGKNTFDRGIKRARFSVLSGVQHPAILFEGGFMSHPYEARLIASEAYQNAISVGIVDAIIRYRFAVSGKKEATKPQ